MTRLGQIAALFVLLLAAGGPIVAESRWEVEFIGGGGPDGLPALESNLGGPVAVAHGPDGSLYIGTKETGQLFRLGSDGLLHLEGQELRIDRVGEPFFPPVDMELAPDGKMLMATDDGVYTWDPATREQSWVSGTESIWTTSVEVDSQGRIYYATSSPYNYSRSGTVHRYDPSDDSLTLIAGLLCDPWSPFCDQETGEGASADQFYLLGPNGLALDGLGNLYISHRSRIRRVDLSEGTIWSVAGTDSSGFSGDGGPASEAELAGPRDIDFDTLGNLLIADVGNNRVRRIDAQTGVITTIAGSGEAGFSGDVGPAVQAALDHPTGLALDASGDLHIADAANLRVRRVDAVDGMIDTVAGNGNLYYSGDGYPATKASIWGERILVDTMGNVFIDETQGYRVRRIDAETGIVTTFVGTGEYANEEQPDGVPASEALVASPILLTFDPERNLYLRSSDGAHHSSRVRVVDAETGLISTIPGVNTIAFGPDGQAYTNDLRRISTVDDLQTGETTVIAGSGDNRYNGEGVPALEAGIWPVRMVVNEGGDVFFTDFAGPFVRKLDRQTGLVETVLGGGTPNDGMPLGHNGTFVAPALGVLFDGGPKRPVLAPDGSLWFTIIWANSVSRLDFVSGLARHEIGHGYWWPGNTPEPPSEVSDTLRPETHTLAPDGTVYVRSGRQFFKLTDTNLPPAAIAVAPATVSCASASGATVRLDGSLSHDPDDSLEDPSTLESYRWYEEFGSPGERMIAKGAIADVELAIGEHSITFVVRDVAGANGVDHLDVRVADDEDPDGDGIGSCSDTCPQVADPDQVDTDGNGLGDPCDSCWQVASTDPDADGICLPQDNCFDLANADQADTDADGIGDACDLCPDLFNPDQAAYESCLRVAPPAGECRSVTVDSAGEGRRGKVMLGRVDRPAPTSLKLKVTHDTCLGEADIFELYLNGGLLLKRPAPIFPYYYCSRSDTYDILDSALISSLWVEGGMNEIRFVKDGAWTRVRFVSVLWTEGTRNRGECLIGWSTCAALSSTDPEPVDQAVTFQHDTVVKTPLSTQEYGPDPLSVSFELPAEDYDELQVCVSATKPGGGGALLAGTRTAELIEIDPFSGNAEQFALISILAEDFDYDRTTGTGYAVSANQTFGVRFDIRDGTLAGPLVEVPRAYETVQFAGADLYAGASFESRYEVRPTLRKLNPDDGSTSGGLGGMSDGFMRGLAYSEADGDLWGYFATRNRSDDGTLRRLDFDAEDEWIVGDPGIGLRSITVGPDGLIYGVSGLESEGTPGELYWLNTDNGAATHIGDTGFTDVYALTYTGEQGAVDCIDFFHAGEQRLAINASCGPPVAAVAPVLTVECTSAVGGLVMLDGSASTDPNSSPGTNDGIDSFDWYVGYGTAEESYLGSGEQLVAPVPFGSHAVTLRVTNRFGESSTAATTATVIDTQPPTLSVTLDPETLWPPNHRMVPVSAAVTATDNCGSPELRLVSVTSSEPDDAKGGGDGHTSGDIQGALIDTADLSFELRAERSGRGNGRVYEVVYQVTDVAGTTVLATARAVVPHSQGGVIEPVDLTLHESAVGTMTSWEDVAGATFYHVVRGDLGSIRLDGSSLDLGTVNCIESGSLDNSTQGGEDPTLPPAGAAFFYLVEFHDGWRYSTYGSESVGWPRLVTGETCR